VAIALSLAGPVAADPSARIIWFDVLDGWLCDDHAEALGVFLETCPDMDGADWPSLRVQGAAAHRTGAARGFFERAFHPVLIGAAADALLTGYYESALPGSRQRGPRFPVPIHRPQRGDVFYGSGDAAGRVAGAVKDPGRMVVLLPVDRAHARLARTVPGG
jgi:membrane-bound lytic murein transglycosylase A